MQINLALGDAASSIEQIKDADIDAARAVLQSFTVDRLSAESALESGIFAVFNQASPWERPTRIIYKLREASHPGNKDARANYASLELLTNPVRVNAIAKEHGWRFHHQDRIGSLVQYVSNKGDGWWNEVVEATHEQRGEYTGKVSYLSLKTFSFWSLCLGGTNLLPLDIHVRRQLAQLGVPIDERYTKYKWRAARSKEQPNGKVADEDLLLQVEPTAKPIPKGNGQYVVDEPAPAEYHRIEREAHALFSKDTRFVERGRVNMGLVASVLWWYGANRGESTQYNLPVFSRSQGGAWKLPYGPLETNNTH